MYCRREILHKQHYGTQNSRNTSLGLRIARGATNKITKLLRALSARIDTMEATQRRGVIANLYDMNDDEHELNFQ